MKASLKQISAICLASFFLSACQLSTDASKEVKPSKTRSLKDTLKAAQNGEYRPPNATEIQEAEALFRRTFQGEQSQALQTAWQTQGFTMRTLTVGNTAFTVVQEDDNKRTGRGFYVFRQTDALPIMLQAPHSFNDEYTGQIVRRLLLEGHYKAAGWNTVSRHQADMAHIDNTLFQAFGRAFAKQYSTGTIVQLHGFAQGKRKSAKGKTADMILSATTRSPSQRLLEMGNCFKSQLTGFVVRIYPNEISELGGTTNSNAKDLRGWGFNSFLHVELSKPLREKLRNDKAVRQKLSVCFQ
jgi:hypothetical protein